MGACGIEKERLTDQETGRQTETDQWQSDRLTNAETERKRETQAVRQTDRQMSKYDREKEYNTGAIGDWFVPIRQGEFCQQSAKALPM